jgi:hypothetical protein
MIPVQDTGNANEPSIWKQFIGLKVSRRNVIKLGRKLIQNTPPLSLWEQLT